MSRFILLFLNGAILTGCAVFIYPARTTIITALLLLLPFLDRAWRMPDIASQQKHFYFVLGVLGLYGLITALHPELVYSAITILFLVALPEEWFFRAYFMSRLESFFSNILMRSDEVLSCVIPAQAGNQSNKLDPGLRRGDDFKHIRAVSIKYQPVIADWLANITTSVFFALIHVPTQGWFGLSVFLPSLFFGWLYQKRRNLILLILLHALSNLFYILYVRDLLTWT